MWDKLIKFKFYFYDEKLPFSLAISGTSYGYKNTSGAFVAFRVDSTDTYTYATNSTGGTVDLGARNNYRYVNATNVYNKGKADGTGSKSMSVSWTRSGPYSNPDRYYINFNVTVNGSRKVSVGFNAYTESVPASFSYSV